MKVDTKDSQNFLVNKSLISKIISKCKFEEGSLVFDIGAGRGFITDLLLQRGYRVLAFEKDPTLRDYLENKYRGEKKVEVWGDFLEFKIPKNRPLYIFSNLPFNQTSLITKKILIDEPFFDEIYLIIQKEAGERILGIFEGLMLSLLIIPKFEIKVIKKLSRYDFLPRPRVDSVIMYFKKRAVPLVSEKDWGLYLDFIASIIMQQKPTIFERVFALTKSEEKTKHFLQKHLINENLNLYQIPKNSYFEVFQDFRQNYSNLHNVVKGSYQKYLDTGAKNLKVFRATKK